MSDYILVPPLFGVFGLVCAFVIYSILMRHPEGGPKVTKIGDAIHLGAMVFMQREYKMLAMFAGVVLVILFFTLGSNTAIAFLCDVDRSRNEGAADSQACVVRSSSRLSLTSW